MVNIKKIVFGIIVTFVVLSVGTVNAMTIKETINANDGYDTIEDGTILIGITKFSPDLIITGVRVSKATYNDVMFNYGTPNYSGVDIYYYIMGHWMQIDENNDVSSIQNNNPIIDKLNNADIYYVNNDEKILEIPYSREVADGMELVFNTDNGKEVEYENGTLYVPATVKSIDIYEKDTTTEEEIKIDTLTKENASDVEFVPTTYVDLTDTIESRSNTLINTYYNKYHNGDLLDEVDDDVFYITLGDYLGSENPTELTIGNNTYNQDPLYMSIGMNAFTNVPVWKIENGKVLLALTWLSADALPDRATNIEIGGQTFMVTIYQSSLSGNILTITDAKSIYGPNGYGSKATIDGNTIDFYYTHGAQALGVELSIDNEKIVDASQIIFRKSTDGSMGLTTTESSVGCTYGLYFHWENGPIQTNVDYVRNYKIAIPGKGVINLILNGHAVSPNVNLTDSIQTKSDAVIDTFYNKYHNGDLIESLTQEQETIYYITLGDYFGSDNPSELTIAGVSYPRNTDKEGIMGISLYMSIGMNAWTYLPVWKIEDGKLMVALTWLSADALPDRATNVVVGGQTFIVTIYQSSVSGNILTLTEADTIYGPKTYASKAVINGTTVDYYYTHGAHALGIKLTLDNEVIADANQIIFRKSANGSMGLTTTESDKGYTYGIYFNYDNNPISAAADYVLPVKLAIPGKGVINLTLNGHAVTSIPE